MRDARADDYYELLGLTPRATLEQIERAYAFYLSMYAEGALATYTLLEPEEEAETRQRLQVAYEALSDPERRHAYDVERGYARPDEPLLPFPRLAEPPPQPGPHALPTRLPEPVTGDALRRFREARGVSLKQISEASKVGVRYLEYIEAERRDFLPAPVYLRGFLQEYARAVGLEPRATADAYLARLSSQ